MRTVIDKQKIYSAEIFESVAEFLYTLKKAKVNKSWKNRVCESMGDDSLFQEFTGTPNFEAAQSYLQKGYKEGVHQLERAKGTIKVSTVVERSKVELNVAGFSPCVPASIQGKPKTMYYTKKRRQVAPVVRLFYQRSVVSTVTNEEIIRAGANVLSLIRFLELHGVRVELYVCCVSRKTAAWDSPINACIVRVKTAAAALNTQLVSYPIIHPSFQRRHVFRWKETSKITVGTSSGYGCSLKNATRVLQAIGLLGKDSYYIDVDMAERAKSVEDLLLRVGLKL